MYKIAICDDTADMLKEINTQVGRYISEHAGRFAAPSLFDNPLLLAESLGGGHIYDVLLLDIFMPGVSGIDLAREERIKNKNTQIIFITTTREFAVEAIALNTTHYLVKPFTYSQLCEALDRAFNVLAAKQEKTIALKSRDGEIYKVPVSDTISVECFGHIQKIVCSEYSFEMRDAMPVIHEQLLDDRFFTLRKGVTVNMDHIRFVGSEYVVMSDGRRIDAAKRTMPEFRRKYLDYTVGG